MHTSVLIENIDKIKKQRNMFLATSILMVISNLLLVLRISSIDQKVVLVPALRQEMMVSKNGVSKSYLEEMSLLFLSNLLDLSPSDIGHKKELIMKYTSSSDKDALDNLIEYFVTAAREYKTFGLTTFFSVKNLEIDLENLSVIAHGILTSHYGKAGYESENETYKLAFDYQGGNLRLKSFSRFLDEEKLKKVSDKNKKFEEEIKENLKLDDTNSNPNDGL